MRRLTSLSYYVGHLSSRLARGAKASAYAASLAASFAACSGSGDSPAPASDAGLPQGTGGAFGNHDGGSTGGSGGSAGTAGASTPLTEGGIVPGKPTVTQSEFVSAPPASNGSWGGLGAGDAVASGAAPPNAARESASAGTTRTVEETDLYRFDAGTNRLYYLNSYRGLMVFDVSNIDDPKLLGRAPIFGAPVEMVVRNGIVSVIIGDWYGTAEDGTPFHGSVVRGYDATDPTRIAQIGEAPIGGWVRDSRVVSDPTSPSGVLYMVSEDYGWRYGWDTVTGRAVSSTSSSPGVLVTSVRFAPTGIQKVDEKRYERSASSCYWYGGGIFHVTNQSIVLAHNRAISPGDGGSCSPPTQTDLVYLDITDPNGAIRERGSITVNGVAQGWGADNGRWNLDFADKVNAHIIGCGSGNGYCGGNSTDNYVLSTADFTNPDAPALASELRISSPGWSVTARFDSNRMYLSPNSNYWNSTTLAGTPVKIYDLSNPRSPALAGETAIPNSVWLFMPAGQQLFALGQLYQQTTNDGGYTTTRGSQVSLSYLDVTQANAPALVGTASFGDGWAWTPAAGTFKAFTKDDSQGLVVLPFSSWNYSNYDYVNGLQLIEFRPPTEGSAGSIATSGTARTKGWVERGILVKNRLVSLSDLSLAVIDYTNRASPVTVKELTLARNVIDATPQSTTLAELSSDWWGNDQSSTALRTRPLSDPEENAIDPNIPELSIPGTYAKVYHSAQNQFAYVVTDKQTTGPCSGSTGGTCSVWTQRVQVVDQSGATPVLRGSVELPGASSWGYWADGWGWYGCWYYDWYNGSNVVQVGDHVLAFRRWSYGTSYEDASSALYVVDTSDPDHPTLASTTITKDTSAWWGNLRAVGNTLYATHYEWWTPSPVATGDGGVDAAATDAAATDAAVTDGGTASAVNTDGGDSAEKSPDPVYDPSARYAKYYLDRIDLSDPAHPKVASRINVPGILVGAKDSDPSVLYTIDYYWNSGKSHNQLAAVQIQGDKAYLLSTVDLEGWVGRVVTQNDRAYMSVESSGADDAGSYWSKVQLHQIDMSDPSHPVDLASTARGGWGWLLDVAGDRAFVSSGWGNAGFDVYKLSNGAPAFEKFVRTRGWSASSMKRKGNTVYLSTGYWGVQAITLP